MNQNDEKEYKSMFEKVLEARKAITDKHGGGKPKVQIVDEMGCPICGDGKLRYSISSVNGHIHGRCNAPNCVSWME